MMAFRMMVGRYFRQLKQHNYDESFVREIAAAYEVAKSAGRPWNDDARQRRSDSMRGKPVPLKLTRKGAVTSDATKRKITDALFRFYTTDPEGVTALNASRQRGVSHWTYGLPRDPATCLSRTESDWYRSLGCDR